MLDHLCLLVRNGQKPSSVGASGREDEEGQEEAHLGAASGGYRLQAAGARRGQPGAAGMVVES